MSIEPELEQQRLRSPKRSAAQQLVEYSLPKLDPSKDTVIVMGGTGFIGSAVCESAVIAGMNVISISRSGKPPLWINFEKAKHCWAKEVHWCHGDALRPKTLTPYFGQTPDVFPAKAKNIEPRRVALVSCIGGFFLSQPKMQRICGDTNMNAIRQAKTSGRVQRAVFISSIQPPDTGLFHRISYFFLRGYFQGKRRTEDYMKEQFGDNGVSLRPGFALGTRWVASGKIPLFLQMPGFVLGFFMPTVHRRSIGDAAIRFVSTDDPFPEKYIANRDIDEFCVL